MWLRRGGRGADAWSGMNDLAVRSRSVGIPDERQGWGCRGENRAALDVTLGGRHVCSALFAAGWRRAWFGSHAAQKGVAWSLPVLDRAEAGARVDSA